MSEEDPLKKMIELITKRREWQREMEDISNRASEEAEREVIAEVWRTLGDHTETYWEAMTLVSKFVEVLKFARSELEGASEALPFVMRQLATCIWIDAGIIEIARSVKPPEELE